MKRCPHGPSGGSYPGGSMCRLVGIVLSMANDRRARWPPYAPFCSDYVVEALVPHACPPNSGGHLPFSGRAPLLFLVTQEWQDRDRRQHDLLPLVPFPDACLFSGSATLLSRRSKSTKTRPIGAW